MPGRFASVKVPHYPKSWKLAGDVLVTGMWLWVLFMCKEKGPYTFGLRDPFADHATPTEYIQYHEKVWSQPPADYVPEEHVAPDGVAVRGARA
ncbi:hypothetical protein FNF27_07368 [Cafeteria roenbergensis]|uniref:Uncharacterized protein n=1 Tax=Cafeteria roenbergensis TaxID=33653 RepID=A0A5A8DPC4_CAFRO|nr:hypothetical protein FNF28_07562 [Cafeteria roenbergensis]KAA0147881.1 hypothetical protein FNF29_07094 [Cafeteria roenbergensis]KAA0150382.1 hypothetical protein FNF31_07037 [Cafeteria roenbergensis]KAA0167285.1 hypothetical protein FNF27_07368 [Cafeteria roenbergensis]|eukprot:KAA0147881.1 hypothetical protein FNF29_07094 [Cafeteria roenbergensis]